jgi:hypothetical protein
VALPAPPPRAVVSLSVTDRTPDGSVTAAEKLAADRLRAAVEGGLLLEGLAPRAGVSDGFRAEVAVVYGAAPAPPPAPPRGSDPDADPDPDTATTARAAPPPPAPAAPPRPPPAALELHALVEVRLVPVGAPASFTALAGASPHEIGEGVAAAPPGGPAAEAYATLVTRLVADLAHALSRRVWPATHARPGAALRAALADPAPERRLEALDEIAGAAATELATDVAGLLNDSDPAVAARCVGVLAELGSADTIPALVKASRGKSGDALYRMLDAAGQIGGKQARAFLDAVASGHPDPIARARAAAALEALARRIPSAPPPR